MEFKFITFKKIRVFYTDELDGGGTTFGQDYLPFIKRLSKKKFNRIYEWCAGPGFIGFSLLANGYCDSLCLSDIHPKAIEAIKKTIKYNKLENKVSVYKSDSLDNIPEKEQWDLVVGNPPHYKKKPTSYTSNGVAANGLTEDQMRIVLDLNLETHKKFFKKVRNYLNKDGIVLLQENWFRVALDEFKEMIEENNFDFKFSSPFSDKFFYLCFAEKSTKINLIYPPKWTIKYIQEDRYMKIKNIIFRGDIFEKILKKLTNN